MLADRVHLGQEFAELFPVNVRMDIPIEDTQRNDWRGRERNIVQLDIPFVKNGHGTESAEVSEEIVRHRQCHVLVKEVEDKV